MIGGRQLPSWMLRSNASNQASISEVKEENKEDVSEELDNKAGKPQKKIKRKQHDTGVPLIENKSYMLKKCEARGSKRNSVKQGEDQADDGDESGRGKKDNTETSERLQQVDEYLLLNKCETKRRKRMLNQQPHGEGNGFYKSEMEDTVEIPVRKRQQRDAPKSKKQKEKDLMEGSHNGLTESITQQLNTPRRKKQKEKDSLEGSHDRITESIASDDGITVDDLIRIAEEYVNAEKQQELQKLQNVGFESEIKPLYTPTSKIGSEKDLIAILDNRISVTDKPLSANSSVTEPLHSGGGHTYPINTDDPAQAMLDLFLGPLLKTSKEVERQADVMTEKLMLGHELSLRSQNDTVIEAAPVTKKKSSLKDKIAMFLE